MMRLEKLLFIMFSLVSVFVFSQDVKFFKNKFTGETSEYTSVKTFADGSPMSADKCDGIIYLQQGSTFYKKIFYGPANVKWFGAKGDGNINDLGTDDTQAVRTAINVLSRIYKAQRMSGGNLYGGFTLYFPAGIYIVNDTFVLPDASAIVGDSYTNTVIHEKNPRFVFTNIRGFASNGVDILMSTDISIKNITLKQGGIELQGASNSEVEGVRIMNLFGNRTDTGILVKLSVNLKLKDIKIFSSTGTGIIFEDTAGTGPSTSTTFDNVWVSHCKTGMLVNGNTDGSHGILTSRVYNSIFEYNETGLSIKGNLENFVMRDIHLEQNKIPAEIDGTVNAVLENIWSDKGIFTIKNTSRSTLNDKSLYLKNVNMPKNIDSSYKGKVSEN